MSTMRIPEIAPELAASHRRNGVWPQLTVDGLLTGMAETRGDHPFVIDADRSIDYARMATRVRKISGWLMAEGIEAGDRVVLHLPNSVTWVEIFCSLVRCGVIPVMATESLRSHDLARLASASGATHLITACDSDRRWAAMTGAADAAAERLRENGQRLATHMVPVSSGVPDDAESLPCRHHPVPSDPLLLQIGGARCPEVLLVGRTHEDYLCSVLTSVECTGLDHSSVMLVPIPASHNYTLASPGILGALAVGATVVFPPDPSSESCRAAVAQHRCTHVPLVPALLRAWVDAAENGWAGIDTLRTIWVGGALLDPQRAARAETILGARIQEVYGMAEGLVCYSPLDLERTPSDRHHHLVPMSPLDEIRLVDQENQTTFLPGPGTSTGELECRGPYTIAGFVNPSSSAKELFSDNGWYRSGDLVRVHRDNQHLELDVIGRTKPQINRAAEKIHGPDIAALLEQHPQVRCASVEAEEDEVLGEAILARVTVLADETGAAPKTLALRKYLHSAGIATNAMPDRFDIEVRHGTP